MTENVIITTREAIGQTFDAGVKATADAMLSSITELRTSMIDNFGLDALDKPAASQLLQGYCLACDNMEAIATSIRAAL